MGAESGERGAGGGGADRARRGRELAAGGPRGGRGARRNRPVGRGDCGRGGRGIPPREADGQYRLRSVMAKADDAGVRRAGAGGATAAPAGREVDDPMPGMPTNPGEAMEERSEERRVGKECRARWAPEQEKKKEKKNTQGERE